MFLGLDGTFDLRNMFVDSDGVESGRKDVGFDTFKFVVSMYIGDSKTSGIVPLVDTFQFVHDAAFGPTVWKGNSTVVENP